MTAENLKIRLADLCARSEQCEYDILQKLRRADISAEEAREIFHTLKQQGFIDNARFARAYTNDKVRFAGWGRLKIRAGLMAKRVSDTDIRAAIEDIDPEDYTSALMRVAKAKADRLDLTDYKDRQKFFRTMAARGFQSSDISRSLSALCSDR